MAGVYDNCFYCKKSITHLSGRGKAKKYCSDECMNLSSEYRKSLKVLGMCSVDGCNEKANRISAKQCERHYYQYRRTGKTKLEFAYGNNEFCNYCGRKSGGNKHCSARCATRSNRNSPLDINCANCNAKFIPINGKLCCSSECKKVHKRKLDRERRAERIKSDSKYADKVRANEYKRKATKKNAYVEYVDRAIVMQRDKWTCHLCRLKIPKKAVWPNGLFGTLDHVMPLARGGLHSYANVKAAHLSCNCSKNDKILGQLGLEF